MKCCKNITGQNTGLGEGNVYRSPFRQALPCFLGAGLERKIIPQCKEKGMVGMVRWLGDQSGGGAAGKGPLGMKSGDFLLAHRHFSSLRKLLYPSRAGPEFC